MRHKLRELFGDSDKIMFISFAFLFLAMFSIRQYVPPEYEQLAGIVITSIYLLFFAGWYMNAKLKVSEKKVLRLQIHMLNGGATEEQWFFEKYHVYSAGDLNVREDKASNK